MVSLLHPKGLWGWAILNAELQLSSPVQGIRRGRSMFVVCFWKKEEKVKVEEKAEEGKEKEKKKGRKEAEVDRG